MEIRQYYNHSGHSSKEIFVQDTLHNEDFIDAVYFSRMRLGYISQNR